MKVLQVNLKSCSASQAFSKATELKYLLQLRKFGVRVIGWHTLRRSLEFDWRTNGIEWLENGHMFDCEIEDELQN